MGRDWLTRLGISKLDRKNDSTSSLFVVSKNSGIFLLCAKTCTFFLGVGGQLRMVGILWSLEVGVLHSSWSSTAWSIEGGVGGQLWMVGILWSLEAGTVLQSSWSSTAWSPSSPPPCSWPCGADCRSFGRSLWFMWSSDMGVDLYRNLQRKNFGERGFTSLLTICIVEGILPSYLLKINYILHVYYNLHPLLLYLLVVSYTLCRGFFTGYLSLPGLEKHKN